MRIEDSTFEQHRTHLLGAGYRITGSIADADDAVKEAWLRLTGLDDAARADIRDLRAWLTTVVGRICLDRLRSAAVRRECYVGSWLPEPLLTSSDDDDPLAAVVRDEGVRMAAMVVLDRLSPPQRVAFVLHEALALPFTEIAEVLGCTAAGARQHASRARRIVAEAAPPPRVRSAEQRDLLARFADAMARADGPALLALLHPDAVWVTDSDGRTTAARRTIVGADKVARLLLGLLNLHGDALLTGWSSVEVNGDPGIRSAAVGTTGPGVTAFAVRDGRIAAVYQMLNPDKLPVRESST